jgi:hypothetical protein
VAAAGGAARPALATGRIYPLACLIAIAVCAFTATGNDRFTAVRQWIKRADQAGLARLRAPGDPMAGRYRAPDEKTIRVVLDRLDPRALARALLGPRPRGRRRSGGPSPASVRRYRARRAAEQAKTLARGRLRAVAVDGKTSRGARRADGTRVHLLGAAEHGGRLLDQLEVGVKRNETSHFTELLGSADLAGAVVNFDAATTPPCRNPPPPRPRLTYSKTDGDIHGTRRSPVSPTATETRNRSGIPRHGRGRWFQLSTSPDFENLSLDDCGRRRLPPIAGCGLGQVSHGKGVDDVETAGEDKFDTLDPENDTDDL